MQRTHTTQTPSSSLLRLSAMTGLVLAAVALAGCSSNKSGGPRTDNLTPPPVTTPITDATNPGGVNGGGGNGGGSNNGGGNGGGGNGGNGGNGGGGNGGGNGGDSAQAGTLETALTNVGEAGDNILPIGLDKTLGSVGQTADKVVDPVTGKVVTLTQQIGDKTRLGKPIDAALDKTGGVVTNLGAKIAESNLPLGLNEGLGGLTSGLGNTLASTGGLLNANGANSNPVRDILGNATGAVGALTASLGGQGGLLAPITGSVVDGSLLGLPGEPVLQPALANLGGAVDGIAPLGLNTTLGNLGQSLDTIAAPVASATTSLTQTVGGATHLGKPVDSLLNGVGNALAGAGTKLDGAVPTGVGGLLGGVGAAVASAGGILHDGPGNANPIGDTLNHVTGGVAALTGNLGGNLLGGGNKPGKGNLLAPVTNLVNGVLAPVTKVASAGKPAGNGSTPLAPVTNLLGGKNGGVLKPVTNILGGVTGGLLPSTSRKNADAPKAPGLLGGLLGGR